MQLFSTKSFLRTTAPVFINLHKPNSLALFFRTNSKKQICLRITGRLAESLVELELHHERDEIAYVGHVGGYVEFCAGVKIRFAARPRGRDALVLFTQFPPSCNQLLVIVVVSRKAASRKTEENEDNYDRFAEKRSGIKNRCRLKEGQPFFSEAVLLSFFHSSITHSISPFRETGFFLSSYCCCVQRF